MLWRYDPQCSMALDRLTNIAAATAQKAPSKTYIKYRYIIALSSWVVAAEKACSQQREARNACRFTPVQLT